MEIICFVIGGHSYHPTITIVKIMLTPVRDDILKNISEEIPRQKNRNYDEVNTHKYSVKKRRYSKIVLNMNSK